MAQRKRSCIYVLCDPSSGAVRYVGQTTDAKRREWLHCSPTNNRGNRRVNSWIRRLLASGTKPVFVAIEDTNDRDVRERHWIAHYRANGAELLNMNDGGSDNSAMQKAERPHVAVGERDMLHEYFMEIANDAKTSRQDGNAKLVAMCTDQRHKLEGALSFATKRYGYVMARVILSHMLKEAYRGR